MIRTFVIVAGFSASLTLSSALLAQQPSKGATSVPDFSGVWAHPFFPGFELPLSGPGPVTNRSRRGQIFDNDGRPRPPATSGALVGAGSPLVGDFTNPILKPLAAEMVKKQVDLEATGVGHPTPWTECWPSGVPFIFQDIAMQILQQPDKVTIVYEGSFRQVRMNQPHPAQVSPSWYGDSVGRYEGDTLVIDTVGIKVGPCSMIDLYGTPYTNALHVVERHRLLDYEATKGALARVANENFRLPPDTIGIDVDRNYRGNGLQLEFTVDNDGVFTTPWSATITYRRGINSRGTDAWVEFVCAENPHLYYAGRDIDAPTAEKPDF
jgi:hypothetical protein